ncbi:MAG: radical SAM protein [Chloroflexi bacterium]|nr:MAG: radical SAM protein [Chloroflexota bacterium]
MIPLQPDVTYGPVYSRRLGRSLGVNLLPTDYKLCSFDCVYCQYGSTDVKTLRPEARHFRSQEEILQAVEQALRRTRRELDYITFSGNGEPTLHPRFPEIVSGVRRLRDELKPGAKLALLSNSTTAYLPHVRESFALLDAPIMKLDAGDPSTLARINRPASGVTFEDIVAGLKEIPGLIVQSVLIDGKATNVHGEPFEAWLAALTEIKPTRVQIYSTERPVPEDSVEQVWPFILKRIAEEIKCRTGIPVNAYWA